MEFIEKGRSEIKGTNVVVGSGEGAVSGFDPKA